MAEGAPLLREYGVNHFIEGSNPSLSASIFLTENAVFANILKKLALGKVFLRFFMKRFQKNICKDKAAGKKSAGA